MAILQRTLIHAIRFASLALCFAFLPFILPNGAHAQAPASAENGGIFDLISSRIGDSIRGSRGRSTEHIDRNVSSILSKMKKDGSFPDINYQDKQRSGWIPNHHMSNVLQMSIAYTTKGSSWYGKADLNNKIAQALEFWHASNPRSNNWWHNEIAVPQAMGKILVLMQSSRSPLPPGLVDKLISRMATSCGVPERQTGANKVDVALHYMYRACVTKDAELMKRSLAQVFYPLTYVTGEGIQHDNSYTQHGPQLYIGGYGNALLGGITETAIYFVGTEFALSGEKLDILSRFVREGFLRTIRGGFISYNVLGRGVTRMNSLSQRGFSGILERMKLIDPKYKNEYDNAILRLKGEKPPGFGIEPASDYFYRTDYTLHQRPGYTCDVRTVSKRTARNEQGIGNGEGYKQYFLSDGAMAINVKGDEYLGIFPAWDWAMIPGVTCPHYTDIPLARQWVEMGQTTFVGGVSDGMYSVSAYEYNDRYKKIDTSARKAWFLFDEEIVCLGNGIESESEFPINTTVNQCLLDGPIMASSKKREKIFGKGTQAFTNNVDWILHGGVGYYFPQGGKVVMKSDTQEGNWYSINTGYSKENVKKEVFSLWFDHGKKPNNEDYAYIVLPGKLKPADMRSYRADQVDILENKETMQAVYHKKLDIFQIVFWKPATFSRAGVSVKADNPCIMMIRDVRSAKPVLYLADPTQSLKEIGVTIKVPGMPQSKTLACDLSGPRHEAGKTRIFPLAE